MDEKLQNEIILTAEQRNLRISESANDSLDYLIKKQMKLFNRLNFDIRNLIKYIHYIENYIQKHRIIENKHKLDETSREIREILEKSQTQPTENTDYLTCLASEAQETIDLLQFDQYEFVYDTLKSMLRSILGEKNRKMKSLND
jgi:flagellar biosynthesis/type III secretory pathway chaperone